MKRWVGKVLIFLLFISLAGCNGLNQKDTSGFTDTKLKFLGEPHSAVSILKAAYGKGPNGEDVIFAGSTGETSTFNVVDAKTGEMLSSHLLQGEPQVWGTVVSPDGNVYFSAGASLYRYMPAFDKVERVGKPIDTEKVLWHITVDEEGKIYGTTYPNGKVFMYDPLAEEFTDYGTMAEGQQYTRSIAYHDGMIYVGTGSEAHLVKLNPLTGNIAEIELPGRYQSESFVYDLDAVEGYLYARVTDSATLLVYDLEEEVWIDEISNVKGITVSPASSDHLVYFNKNDELHAYDPKKRSLFPTGFRDSWANKGFGWIELNEPGFESASLISTLADGKSWVYNPDSGERKYIQGLYKEEPVVIQSVGLGPDGDIYTSGYLSGGFAKYSQEKEEIVDYGGFGQIENMISTDENLYLGVYTKANIYMYDPQKKYHFDRGDIEGSTNPKKLFSLEQYGQDRPFGLAWGDGKLFVGTVPSYGKLGGVLAMYDEKTEQLEVFQNIVKNQSVVELAYKDGLVYGATSVFGGLGIRPSEEEAKLFIFDPEKKEIVYEDVPLPGEKAISTLEFDEQGYLWGMSPGKIFKFDLETKMVVHTEELFQHSWEGINNYWKGSELIYDDGVFYGLAKNRFFTYNTRTSAMRMLETNVASIEQDNDGTIFLSKGTKLYRYKD